jgi:hypothetical protein
MTDKNDIETRARASDSITVASWKILDLIESLREQYAVLAAEQRRGLNLEIERDRLKREIAAMRAPRRNEAQTTRITILVESPWGTVRSDRLVSNDVAARTNTGDPAWIFKRAIDSVVHDLVKMTHDEVSALIAKAASVRT